MNFHQLTTSSLAVLCKVGNHATKRSRQASARLFGHGDATCMCHIEQLVVEPSTEKKQNVSELLACRVLAVLPAADGRP